MSNQWRKKPVVIEARQMIGTPVDCMQVADWVKDSGYPWLRGNALEPETLEGDKGIWIDPEDGFLVIRTLEGDMKVTTGDYIIKGVAGEFYPCKPDIFLATYEKVDDE